MLRTDGSNTGVLGEIAPIVQEGIINRGLKSSPLHKGLVVDRVTFCSKNRVSGRSTAPILSSSSARVGIDTIIVTGIATNVCCETTAREAAVRDFRVFFLSDGTTTFGIGDVSAAQTVDEMIGEILPSAFPCVAKNFEPG